jgi:hypothetical protein
MYIKILCVCISTINYFVNFTDEVGLTNLINAKITKSETVNGNRKKSVYGPSF